jgi:putative membrane protein
MGFPEMALLLFITLLILAHIWFLILESFLWEKRSDLRAKLGFTEPTSREAVALARNQGLYNGFLAAGLCLGMLLLYLGHEQTAHVLVGFFLTCIAVAGVVGYLTVRPPLLGALALLVGQTSLAVVALACLGLAVAK